MKAKAIEDTWRHLAATERCSPRVSEYFTGNLDGFERTTLNFPGFLHAICGVNSSGKTRLLRQLHKDILDGSPCIKVTGGDSFREDRVHFIDIAWLVHRQREGTDRFSNFGDLIEESTPIALTERELATANYLSGHQYEEILIWEVEDINQQNTYSIDNEDIENDLLATDEVATIATPESSFRPEHIPFFKVTRDGTSFDTHTLSRGELTCLTLMWVFRQAEKNSLFIIDEPEVYLSPDAASKILDVIGWWTDRRASQSIVATHAAEAIANMDMNYLTLLAPNHNCPPSIEPQKASVDTLYTHLRLKASPTHIFVVEDYSAERLARRLLQEVKFKHLDRSSFWIAEGNIGVRHASNLPDFPNSGVKIVALADGDEAGTNRKPQYGSSVVFLPIDINFEQFVLDESVDWSTNCSPAISSRIHAGLHLSKGHDPHDGLKILADYIGMTPPTLASNVLDWWLSKPAGKSQLERFKNDLDSLLPGSVNV